ncbi:hypothetical protein Tco_0947716 [Tanacetum coccineum]
MTQRLAKQRHLHLLWTWFEQLEDTSYDLYLPYSPYVLLLQLGKRESSLGLMQKTCLQASEHSSRIFLAYKGGNATDLLNQGDYREAAGQSQISFDTSISSGTFIYHAVDCRSQTVNDQVPFAEISTLGKNIAFQKIDQVAELISSKKSFAKGWVSQNNDMVEKEVYNEL